MKKSRKFMVTGLFCIGLFLVMGGLLSTWAEVSDSDITTSLSSGTALEPYHIGTDYTFSGNYSSGMISINSSGAYYLTDNLQASSLLYGIQIDTENAILNGNAKSIFGTRGSGINITTNGNNATITNFNQISGFSNGISSYGDHALISNNVANNNSNGIDSRGNYARISENTVYNNSRGIFVWVASDYPSVQGGNYTIITNNIAYNNSDSGIVSGGDYAQIIGNTAFNNFYYGICAGGSYWVGHTDPGKVGHGYYATIADNTVYENANIGIWNQNPNARIIGNHVNNNNKYGIYLHRGSTNTTISENIIENEVNGLQVMTNNYSNITVTRNTITDASENGIYFRYEQSYGVSGGNGTIYDNHLVNLVNVGGSGSITNFTFTNPAGPKSGTNIMNGPYIAGNYWSNPSGTGWSDLQIPDPNGYTTYPYEVESGTGVYDTAPLVRIEHDLTVQSDRLGWISPSGNLNVSHGSSQTFTFMPTAGAVVKNLTVNGNEVTPIPESPYTITDITGDLDIQLNNEPIPGLVIAAFTATSLGGNSVRFTDASWGKPTSWKWDFGDGTQGSDKTIDHTYANPGTYTVSLWARNDLSQSQEIKGEIVVPMTGETGTSMFFGP